MEHVQLTLCKMAYGGIYDQVGGGFARYSVDEIWKVPHFEKMLYDNAQLVSLYCEAYQASGHQLYKQVVLQTLQFVEREMTSPLGAFYSALDADSEGMEGKYYVWTEKELQDLLAEDFEWVKDYYSINAHGYWEHDNHILLRTMSDEEFVKSRKWDIQTLRTKVEKVNLTLIEARNRRTRPGLDDKQLTSWNALMLKAYVDAYRVFGDGDHLTTAICNAEFILSEQRRPDGGLWHGHKDGRSTINGFLEDYCFTIEAFLSLYEATFERRWLDEAEVLADHVITHFSDERTAMFYVASDSDSKLIARKMELSDNVIPSSNSSMAIGLFKLGILIGRDEYVARSKKMLANMLPQLEDQGPWFANWASLLQMLVFPFYEVAVVGPNAEARRTEMEQHYRPNKLLVGGTEENGLPLLAGRAKRGLTRIYVCEGNTCLMAVDTVKEALVLMKD